MTPVQRDTDRPHKQSYTETISVDDERCSIGVDVGGTKILCGIIDADGRVVSTSQTETRPLHLLADIEAMVETVRTEALDRGRALNGIGIGMKGAVDAHTGRLVRSITLGLADIAVTEPLQQRFGLHVWMENDVHAGTLGELAFGIGKTHRDFIMFNAGTGIAAGFVLDRRLHVGASGKAGEIGHMVVAGNMEARCTCGRSGCLEDLIHRSRRGEPVAIAAHDALEGLPVAYQLLALALANLVNTFNPSAVVCMGGMLMNNTPMIAKLDQAVRSLALLPAVKALSPIVPAFGGYQAGLVGAGSLPFIHMRARTAGAAKT